ncbi:MAG: endopeptidase La [Spirochaetes bacterium GWC1_27_15]|nr:MAG: endopeptidase La [Spirochaetes bacterium GWB1_27_13]OHD26251.1 MAG: endopeptidase La [Spirochaetes bacterium GWC1_27_15]
MKILNNISTNSKKENEYPLIPLREMVVFPGILKTFYVGRFESVEAVNLALASYDKNIFLVTQKDSNVEKPTEEDIYEIGVISQIVEVRPGPDKKIIKLLVRGIDRAKIVRVNDPIDIRKATVEKINFQNLPESLKSEALITFIVKEFKKFSSLAKMSAETLKTITQIESEEMLLNMIIPHLKISLDKQIELLEEINIEKRLTILGELIVANIEVLQLEKRINGEVRKKLEKNQKEYYLNEQIKEIQKELGYIPDENDVLNIEEFEKKLINLGMPDQVRAKAIKEQKRLMKMPPISPESSVIRTYIEWLQELPWQVKSDDSKDLNFAKKILDEEHYSLHKVKNRILEFLAVRTLNPQTKGPILCFVGPPGTGKTSLANSVAKAIGREFVRISLGGVRDEAEIRGHRRTYLGALPGKIIQSMKKVKTTNPVFLLDEIDKMSSDFRGDPASALLEVLDPEQNYQFVDHYLEVPYNLSEVMFITTANSLQGIPYPLLDRMEIIYISSYTEIEKLHIAKQFLIPKQRKENGIENINLTISDKTIYELIRSYTMEAGVRSLQRQIASICRKIAKKIVLGSEEVTKVSVNTKNLMKFLGKKKYIKPAVDKVLDIGVSHGLAWSEVGGSLLPIEIVLYPGAGKIILTGKLGEVMKESAQTAFSYIRANAYMYDIKYKDFFKDFDVHVHVPEGATPKDGPSAGIAITCGILSALTKTPMHSNVAMTGEITLTGKVLPIGGLKEKTLAAARHKKEIVIVPYENEKDLEELPRIVKQKIEFKLVKKADEVFRIVFDNEIYAKPKPIEERNNNIPKIDITIPKTESYNTIITQ